MKRARALLALLLAACASGPATNIAPPTPWTQWPSPAAAGFDAQTLDAARARADELKSGAVMVIHRGHVVAAWGDVARKLQLHSVRKSLYAAMYGVAVEKGLIDVNATLESLGIDDMGHLTADEKRARIDDLLYARSGVYHPAAYAPGDQQESRPKRGSHAAGTNWFYNNWDFNVAGVLLERAAKKPLGELFDEWIAKPIGMEDFVSSDVDAILEPRTSLFPALTFRMSTRDLARFGQLWMNDGRWNGRQVVPAEWIARASESRSQMEAAGEGYAMMWWTYAAGSLPKDRYPNANRISVLQARGTGGQVVALAPELDLVFVHRGDTDHGREVRGRDVWLLFEQILAARTGQPVANAAFVPMQSAPLTSQLPPFEWPPAIELDRAQREALTGDYKFAQGFTATIYLHEGRLFASMPRQGEAELFAITPTEFYVRVDPTASVRFENGKVIVRISGREMVGTKL